MRDACLGDAFRPHLGGRNEALVALAYDTGLRAGELAALDVEHLDLEADPATVYLPARIQKGEPGSRTLALGKYGADSTRVLRRWLRDRWKDTRAVFPSREADRMSTRSLRRAVKRVAEAAGVEPELATGGTGAPSDVTPHTLRHSVAYRIVREEGGRLEDVQLRLRHRNLQTTDQVYAHLVPR
jgi:integrase